MKTTLNTYDIANALMQDSNANWSYNGAKALAEYLEELEESIGEELELDVVAIRCDYSEYSSLQEWAAEYYSDWKDQFSNFGDEFERAEALKLAGEIADAEDIMESIEDDLNEEIRQNIQWNGSLIEFDGGIIVSSF